MAEGIGYELKITPNGGEPIYIGSDNLTSVEFLVDTINENAKDRSENIVNKVTIKGKITDEIKGATRDLLLWSLATKSEEVYRRAEIIIRINDTTRVRKYTMDKVFCLDYLEQFNKGDEDSIFELKFSQRKDNFGGIEVIC